MLNSDLLQLVYATPIPSNMIPDSVCWGLSENGDFSTKSATWVAHWLSLKNPKPWEFNWIWKLDVMPKLKKNYGNYVSRPCLLGLHSCIEAYKLIPFVPTVTPLLKMWHICSFSAHGYKRFGPSHQTITGLVSLFIPIFQVIF